MESRDHDRVKLTLDFVRGSYVVRADDPCNFPTVIDTVVGNVMDAVSTYVEAIRSRGKNLSLELTRRYISAAGFSLDFPGL